MFLVRAAARAAVVALAAASVLAGRARGQQPAPAPAAPEVGQMAPDFEVAGATRYGLLRSPFRLSEYRGQTIVLSFFPAARTKG